MRATQPQHYRGGVAHFFFFFFHFELSFTPPRRLAGDLQIRCVFEISGDLGFRSQRARKHREPIPF